MSLPNSFGEIEESNYNSTAQFTHGKVVYC